ncbi:outer membrane protein [Legionella maioricensis]|uniref:Outer membrane beta-barrel protein n=1 Tax=Legionella maioricensis TaxID=2896528 RepID=A0A9X2D3C7_9GAMM|nr:outer membrane beta-barrel protein [Legionella maioricensis]MCL9685766.1 outer membrane beta-barrel protein [Legionella maioricensis]MCL9689173.1 outer membrane beta-barrel protein [Legionella maioricensis]
MKTKLFIVIMLILFKTSIWASSQISQIYVKFGPDYFWSQSNDYFIKRINPIEGSLTPFITPGSLNDGNWAGNVAIGFTYPLTSIWKLNPEASYLSLGNYSKTFNPFISGPYESNDIINTFHSTMKGKVIAAVFNVEYLINSKYSVYVAPGLGVANIRTKNALNYQSSEDETNLLMVSNESRNNFSPQVSVGVKYALTSNFFFDLGVNYIGLGTIPFGTYSNDADYYTATKIAANNAHLWGPKLNIIYYFS